MEYLSVAQFPRSSSRQRSLQNGMFGSLDSTDLPQIGQRNVTGIPILLSDAICLSGVGFKDRERIGRLEWSKSLFRTIYQAAHEIVIVRLCHLKGAELSRSRFAFAEIVDVADPVDFGRLR